MGGSQSTNPNISNILNNIVAQIYLDNTQRSGQYLGLVQNFTQECGNDPDVSGSMQEFIKTCSGKIKDNIKNEDPSTFNDYFTTLCTPNNCGAINNVKMSEIISIDASSFQSQTSDVSFSTDLQNAISQNADIQKAGFSPDFTAKNVINSVNKVYNSLGSQQFQRSLLDIAAKQKFKVVDQAYIDDVNISDALDLVSNTIQSVSTTQSDFNEMVDNIIQKATIITQSGLVEVIAWLIRIVLLAVSIILLFFIINLLFEVYILMA
jgi:hypothetical protein